MPRTVRPSAASGTIAGPDASGHFWPSPGKTQWQTGPEADKVKLRPDPGRVIAGRDGPKPGCREGAEAPPMTTTRARLRLTLRRMMTVVAIAGIALGLGIEGSSIGKKRELFQRLARVNRFREGSFSTAILEGPPETHASQKIEHEQRSARYRDDYPSLAEKYERAARYPWSSVAPDPPRLPGEPPMIDVGVSRPAWSQPPAVR